MKKSIFTAILITTLSSCFLIEENENNIPTRLESNDQLVELLLELHPDESHEGFCQKRAQGVRFESYGTLYRYRTNEKGEVNQQIHAARRGYRFSNVPKPYVDGDGITNFILSCGDESAVNQNSQLVSEVLISRRDGTTGSWRELNNGNSVGNLNSNCEIQLAQELSPGTYQIKVITHNAHNLYNSKLIDDSGLVVRSANTIVCKIE